MEWYWGHMPGNPRTWKTEAGKLWVPGHPRTALGDYVLREGRRRGGHFRYAKGAKPEGKYCSLFIVLSSCLFEFKNSLQIFLNVKNRNKLFRSISCQRGLLIGRFFVVVAVGRKGWWKGSNISLFVVKGIHTLLRHYMTFRVSWPW